MQFQDETVVNPNAYNQAIPVVDPGHHAAIASVRTTLVFTIVLGTFFPFVSFICGIILLVKSSSLNKGQGMVAFTGILALFWMPIIAAIFAIVTLASLGNGY